MRGEGGGGPGQGHILAVASGGGHWEQLLIISESFGDARVTYVTTDPAVAGDARLPEPAVVIADCNRNRPLATLGCAWQAFWLLRRTRPDFVVTTGAAPGLIVLVLAKLAGAKAVWIDSVANAERLSLSGRIAGWFADLHLTQWEHVAAHSRARYMGSVL